MSWPAGLSPSAWRRLAGRVTTPRRVTVRVVFIASVWQKYLL